MQNQMTTEQALSILRETTAQIQANLPTHQAIVTAIDTLETAVAQKLEKTSEE